MGKKRAFVYFSILTGILYMLIAFIGRTSIPFLILRVAIGCFSVVGGMLIPVFANDIADYNLMKYGTDNRAMIQSISGTDHPLRFRPVRVRLLLRTGCDRL